MRSFTRPRPYCLASITRAHLADVEAIFAALLPGQRQGPVDVAANDAEFGGIGRGALHPRDLFEDACLDLGRHGFWRHALAQLLRLAERCLAPVLFGWRRICSLR